MVGEAIYPQLPEPASGNGDAQGGSYTIKIDNYSNLADKKWHSETFTIGGNKWRLLVYPRGNQCDSLSVYLDVADADALSFGWQRSASFKLVLICDADETRNATKESQHTFTSREPDWGFTHFVPLADLSHYIVSDSLKMQCDIQMKKDPYNWTSYDSKKETGFIGFKNQGATCYMNSLLQTLFHVPFFRKAVYHLPTTETDVPESSIPLALQTLFYKMQFQDTPVSTKELTKSFGWDQVDSFTQHDVQELNRVLCEKLEQKMKDTVVEKAIPRLFEGKSLSYIECVNVDCKSARAERFEDLQLDVKGCRDVYASFDKYVEVENLDGSNQYQAEGHGLQDARKGVWFQEFPPVLELQLRRFGFDFQRDVMFKINDRYEFPDELDLDKYLAPEVRAQPGRKPNKYTLHSVLVHSGGVHGGHYYAFIRPKCAKGEQWFRFDDERVTKEEQASAVDAQFGGDDDPPGLNTNLTTFKMARFSNAYMLVYVRDCDRDWVVCDVAEEEIAEHLRLRVKREAEERAQRKKEREEAHLYTVVKVATGADMHEQIGDVLHFDLVNHDKVKSFRVPKATPFSEIQRRVAEEMGVPVASQRYWSWAKRQNVTFRPAKPLDAAEEALTVSELKSEGKDDLRLWLESPFPADPAAKPGPPREIARDVPSADILLFFKYFDPEGPSGAPGSGTLRFAGWRFESVKSQVGTLRDFCCSLVGLPAATELLFFEEIKSEPNVMCEAMDAKSTLKGCQLEDGDIICFQRAAPQAAAATPPRFPKVPDYLAYIKDRMPITCKELAKSKDPGFVLELFKHNTYDEVTQRLAEKLGVADATTIRLTAHNVYTHAPKPQPLKFRQPESLVDMVTQHSQVADTLYYEVLDIPVGEVEKLKVIKVAFNNAKTEEVGHFSIRLPRDQTVAEMLEELRRQLLADPSKQHLSGPAAELRMFDTFYNKIFKVYKLTDKVENIAEAYWHLRAEEVPEEEKSIKTGDRAVHCYHFCMAKDEAKDSAPQLQNFGYPFLLRIDEDESLATVKRRIQAKLGIADEEFSKWRFAAVQSGGRVEYLEDDAELIASRVKCKGSENFVGSFEVYLGMEHEDKHPKRHQSRYPAEKPVKIYN